MMSKTTMAKETFEEVGRVLERQTIRYGKWDSRLGLVLAAQTDRGVCSVMLGDDYGVLQDELKRRFPRAVLVGDDAGAEALARDIAGSFDGAGQDLEVALDLIGTEFQRKVWQELVRIPRGTTTTYADIARRIGAPKAVRAVGTACGANHVAVIVPCHRVLNGTGGLSGYRWGVERKRALLEWEGENVRR